MSTRTRLIALSVCGLAALSAPAAHGTVAAKQKCDPAYKGKCLKPNVSDYDCAGGSGDGPYYVAGPSKVVGRDHYRLDADHDGVACEK
jgi:hypothetical protein